MYKLDNGIVSSNVDFLKKSVSIIFKNSEVTLKEIVILLSSIGYEPLINLDKSNSKRKLNSSIHRKLILKIGIAGFCLGNIMLLSFPEYLGLDSLADGNLKFIFNYLNILFSLPVFFYCSSDYFKSAWTGLKNKLINIDFPVSLGLAALFLRSIYEIIFFNNAGFIDSLAGLVFLLLLGKLFQSKTYESMNFERDFKSYFPVSVTVKKNGIQKSIPVTKLEIGDRIIIRNTEIIPADAILFNGAGNIDYSFVTGESIPEVKVMGEIIYAGGRHFGTSIELEVIRKVSQSYLTQLWNDSAFKKNDSNIQPLVNKISKYFTFAILIIAFSSAIYWLRTDVNLALNAFTTVLIIACPCALALTTPFALGNTMRIFGRNKFYLKNSFVIESLAKTDSIVFDKTGTITNSKNMDVKFTGSKLKLCEYG
ncbi:MAG: HAD-IC family P-type ATPase, partial [Ignavibacteria bacterium]|nr:HAD-IC family P-type ATPase [Ignavibacteria bacterium]